MCSDEQLNQPRETRDLPSRIQSSVAGVDRIGSSGSDTYYTPTHSGNSLLTLTSPLRGVILRGRRPPAGCRPDPAPVFWRRWWGCSSSANAEPALTSSARCDGKENRRHRHAPGMTAPTNLASVCGREECHVMTDSSSPITSHVGLSRTSPHRKPSPQHLQKGKIKRRITGISC